MAKIELNGLTGQILLNEEPVIDLTNFKENKSMLYKGSMQYGTDLNDLSGAGIYHQLTDANAATGFNFPEAKAGVLLVTNDNDLVYQTYYVSGVNTMYFRSRSSSVWTSWALTALIDDTLESATSTYSSNKIKESLDELLARPSGIVGEYLSMVTNVTLTPESNRSIVIVDADSSYSIYLPNATELESNGGVVFYLSNHSYFNQDIRDADGKLLMILSPDENKNIWCTDITTPAGKWSIEKDSIMMGDASIIKYDANASFGKEYNGVFLNERDFVFVYKGLNNYSYLVRMGVSDSNIRLISAVQLGSQTYSLGNVCKITDTKFIVFFRNTTTATELHYYVYNITGETSWTPSSLGTYNLLTGSGIVGIQTDYVSDDKIIVSYNDSVNDLYVLTVTFSNLVATFNSYLLIDSDSANVWNGWALKMLTSNSGIITSSSTSNTYSTAWKINISGTAITKGTAKSLSISGGGFKRLIKISDTECMLLNVIKGVYILTANIDNTITESARLFELSSDYLIKCENNSFMIVTETNSVLTVHKYIWNGTTVRKVYSYTVNEIVGGIGEYYIADSYNGNGKCPLMMDTKYELIDSAYVQRCALLVSGGSL